MKRGRSESLAATLLLALGAVTVAACGSSASAPRGPAAGATTTGFFSATQVDRGRASYDEVCGECHFVSEFRGPDFEFKWRRRTAWDLYAEVSTNMPENRPGELSESTYAAIIAYILSVNGYQVGGPDLAVSEESMALIALGPGAEKTTSGGSSNHDC